VVLALLALLVIAAWLLLVFGRGSGGGGEGNRLTQMTHG
jgi:hypothetical protein